MSTIENYIDVLGFVPKIKIVQVEDEERVARAQKIALEEVFEEPRLTKKFGTHPVEILTAPTVKQARELLDKVIGASKENIVLIHLDQVLGDELGSTLIDDIRFKDGYWGTLLVSGQPRHIKYPVRNYAHRLISKPVSLDELLEGTTDLIRKILQKVPTKKRLSTYQLTLKIVDSKEMMQEYFKVRYQVFGPRGMGYIPDSRQNEDGLDIDKYDTYAIPFVGTIKVGDKEVIATCLRLIMPTKQEKYSVWIDAIIAGSKAKEPLIEELNRRMPGIQFPSEETYDYSDFYAANPGSTWCELSRTTVPDFIIHPQDPEHDVILRGFGYSRNIMEFGEATALHHNKPFAVASCDPKHVVMYAKYGYRVVALDSRRIRGDAQIQGDLIFIPTVANVSNQLWADFRALPEPTATNVGKILEQFQKGNFIYRIEPEVT